MDTLSVSRVCRKCQQDKPFTEFYVRSGYGTPDNPAISPGHFSSECKSCLAIRSVNQQLQPRRKIESVVASEALLINRLFQEGIYSLPGKALGATDVDVLAYNVVRVEAKYSKLLHERGISRFTFDTTPKQRQRGFRASVTVLICEYAPDRHTFHVFPADHAVFFMRGRMKHSIAFVPGQMEAIRHGSNRVVMTQPLMDEHENRWDILEAERQVIMEHARSGATMMQLWGMESLGQGYKRA